MKVGTLRINETYASHPKPSRHRVVSTRVGSMEEATTIMQSAMPPRCYRRVLQQLVMGQRLGWKTLAKKVAS